jgi:hypothetical protein
MILEGPGKWAARVKPVSLERFLGPGITHLPAAGQIDSTGRKTALAATLAARDTIKPVKAQQQLANAAAMPFAAPRRFYLSLVQLPRDDTDGDEARFPKLSNCRSQSSGPCICGLLDCQSLVGAALAHRDQAQAR